MFRNACYQTFRLSKLTDLHFVLAKDSHNSFYHPNINRILHHRCQSNERKQWFKSKQRQTKEQTTPPPPPSSSSQASIDPKESNELTTVNAKEIFEKEFSEYFSDGKFITRISYVDYIDQALEKMKALGLEKNLEAYKELLRIFPPGRYCAKSRWDFGLFHAPQQLCAIRLLFQMEINMVRPDKEIEKLVIQAFSKNSEVWKKCARMIYWSMKGRNVDPNPLPEKIPERTHEIAKVALLRMLDDPKALISVKNTSSLPNVIDKTWIVHSQSPTQQSIIQRLSDKTILYIEEYGLSYVNEKFLSYFVIKLYEDEETVRKRQQPVKPDHNYNNLKMKFYGKPIKEKIQELESVYRVDDGYILGIAITGTSSHDSVLSWLKLLQQRNPNLNNLNIVFRLNKPVSEIIDIESSDLGGRRNSK